jgi:16S rRNA processing protein RimM
MVLVVAVVGKPHGLRGEVTLDVRTDSPELRFAAGQVLTAEPGGQTLTVAAAREHQGRWVVRFAEVSDRTGAEQLRGASLLAPATNFDDDDDAWYAHELVDMQAQLADGTAVGKIIGVEHGAAQDLLVLRESDGTQTWIPFVHAIVPHIDKDKGVVTLDPPGGLLASDKANLVVSDETSGDHLERIGGQEPVDEGSVAPVETEVKHQTPISNMAEHRAEEAYQQAAPLAPEPGEKMAGEIIGTMPAEDVEAHRHGETSE